MRKFLITIAILIVLVVAIAAAWIFAGKQASLYLDRFRITEVQKERVSSIRYEGNGTGGVLHINQLALSLAPASSTDPIPTVGLSKDGQLALADGGKVFAFGPLPKTANDAADVLETSLQPGDDAEISLRHSALSWPTPFEMNFMSGQSPAWKRHSYNQLVWKRSSGSKLEMLWRHEQYFYRGNGWTGGTMTREGMTGLIRVEISN